MLLLKICKIWISIFQFRIFFVIKRSTTCGIDKKKQTKKNTTNKYMQPVSYACTEGHALEPTIPSALLNQS